MQGCLYCTEIILRFMRDLRSLVREVIKEMSLLEKKDEPTEELLTEPDDPSEENQENEVSAVSSIAGVTTPLGTGPTYPSTKKPKKKKKLRKGWQKSK